MVSDVLTLDEARRWRDYLERLPGYDTYFLPEFHRLGELGSEGTAYCFVAEDDGDLLLHPYFRRRIDAVGEVDLDEELYDIETASGYTGPLATTADPGFLDRAWQAHASWCSEHGVVAEFVRFNPLLSNAGFARGYAVAADRDLVVLELPADRQALWTSYPSVQRNMVRKARKSGVVVARVPLEAGLPAFRRFYEETMLRVDAYERFHYGDAYFRHLADALGDHATMFTAFADDEPVASAIFLVHERLMHFHLAGSGEHGRRCGANNLILHAAAEWALDLGVRHLNLGGGRTRRADDELLRFKGGVSRRRQPYLLGKRVHDEAAYRRLGSLWLEQSGSGTAPDHFFFYRLPLP